MILDDTVCEREVEVEPVFVVDKRLDNDASEDAVADDEIISDDEIEGLEDELPE